MVAQNEGGWAPYLQDRKASALNAVSDERVEMKEIRKSKLALALTVSGALAMTSGCFSSNDSNDPIGDPKLDPVVDPDPVIPPPKTANHGDPDAPVRVAVRAAYDASNIAINFQWQSNKNYFGVLHGALAYDATTAKWAAIPTAAHVNEDRVIINLQAADNKIVRFDNMGCWAICHDTMEGMPNEQLDGAGAPLQHHVDSTLPGQGTGVDMWHYRGARSGPMGYAEDTWVSNTRGRDNRGALNKHLRGSQTYTSTWEYKGVTYKLPDYVFDPAKNSGSYFLTDGNGVVTQDRIDDLRLALTLEAAAADKLQHALIVGGPKQNTLFVPDLVAAGDSDKLNAITAEVAAGALTSATVLFYDETSDQQDIGAATAFDAETQTISITMVRKLNTGAGKKDVSLASLPGGTSYTFGFAVHDNNGHAAFHRISVPLKLGTSATNDVVAKNVSGLGGVAAVDWAAIDPYESVNFVPRTATGDHLLDDLKHSGAGGLRNGMTCTGCHTVGDGNRYDLVEKIQNLPAVVE